MARYRNYGCDNPDDAEYCEKCNTPLGFDVFISYSRLDYVDENNRPKKDNHLTIE